MTRPSAAVAVTIAVPKRTPPMVIRVMRGRRLVHVFDERELSAQPVLPQAEAEQ